MRLWRIARQCTSALSVWCGAQLSIAMNSAKGTTCIGYSIPRVDARRIGAAGKFALLGRRIIEVAVSVAELRRPSGLPFMAARRGQSE